MTFQTLQKDDDNRYKNSPEGLNPEICSIWLGARDSNPRSWDQNPVPYHLASPQQLGYCSKIVRVFPERGPISYIEIRAIGIELVTWTHSNPNLSQCKHRK